jgi:hypothetical protein
MYPADGLGDTYEASDLPDEIRIVIPLDPVRDEIATRSGSTFTGDSTRVRFVDRSDDDEPNIWQVEYDEPAESGNWLDFAQLDCLIRGDGNFTPGDDLVEDQFADTYTMSPSSLNGAPLVRTSLCVWTDEDEDGRSARLRYGEGQVAEGDPVTLGWWLGHDIALDATDFYNYNFETKKTGDQNSPAGSYTFGTGSNTYTVTISE